MAINTNLPPNEYIATALQTIFTFNFKIFTDTDIVVFQTPSGQTPNDATDILTLNTHYTVTIDGDNGGTITLLTGASVGDMITLTRELPITRDVDYQQGGDILAETSNNDQEYQTYLIQDQETANNRFITIPKSSQGINLELDAPLSNSYIRWDSNGTGLENDTTIPQAVITSSDSVLDSESWANENEDVPVKEHTAGVPSDVTPESFSSKHYAAKSSATAITSQLKAWEAEAEQLTADSYATEPEDSFVKVYTSDGDGTFTATDTTEYSALHHAAKAQANADSINPDSFVDKESDESIDGVKTFTSFPVTPSSAPTTDYQAANKKYVDDNTEAAWVANDSRAKTALNATGNAGIYACRAWANINTITNSVRGSGNVSSITDNGTGDFDINFTATMPDEFYAIVGITNESSTPGSPTLNEPAFGGCTVCLGRGNEGTSQGYPLTQSVANVKTLRGSSSGTNGAYVDVVDLTIAVFR